VHVSHSTVYGVESKNTVSKGVLEWGGGGGIQRSRS